MSSSINSAYGAVAAGTDNKLYVPVNPPNVIYSHFDHVSGFAAGKNQKGVSISKIHILNTLIDHLVSIKTKTKPETGELLSDEQIDVIIENYQTQIQQSLQSMENTPYVFGIKPETGILFNLSA